MRRLLTALAGTVVICAVICAPALADDDDFTSISACGSVIDQPGHYKLTNDLIGCDVPDLYLPIIAAVKIASSDVVLDLDGHTISCQPSLDLFTFGVFSDFGNARVQIRDGTVTGCILGIETAQNEDVSIKNMKLVANVFGIEILAGSRVEVKGNEITDNYDTGIVATSFFPPVGYVGPGVDHRIHKNLISNNGFFGITAGGIEDTVISCNRTDRNYGGISLNDPGFGNTVRKNVANYNLEVGIAVLGLIAGEFVIQPIAQGNTIMHNTALGNGRNDMGEVFVDVTTPGPDLVLGTQCLNAWKNNNYVSSIAVEDCISAPKYFRDENSCAPGNDY